MKAYKDKIILRGTFKQENIVLPDAIKNGTERKLTLLDSLKVFSVGKDIKALKVGDEVIITRYVLQDSSKIVMFYKDRNESEDEFFIAVEEKDIVGIY